MFQVTFYDLDGRITEVVPGFTDRDVAVDFAEAEFQWDLDLGNYLVENSNAID